MNFEQDVTNRVMEKTAIIGISNFKNISRGLPTSYNANLLDLNADLSMAMDGLENKLDWSKEIPDPSYLIENELRRYPENSPRIRSRTLSILLGHSDPSLAEAIDQGVGRKITRGTIAYGTVGSAAKRLPANAPSKIRIVLSKATNLLNKVRSIP